MGEEGMNTKRKLCGICGTNEAVEGDTLCEECIVESREYPYQENTTIGIELDEKEYFAAIREEERSSWYDWQGYEE